MIALPGFADLHCHLMDGMDDGPRSPEESVALCRSAVQEGASCSAATVHQLGSFAHNTRSRILESFERLQRNLSEAAVDLKIFPSAEWLIEPEWLERFDSIWPDLLTIADGGKFALIEFAHRVPHHIDQIARRLADKGVRPVLAHVDRYPELFLDPVQIEYLLSDGFIIQLNTDSIDGRCGPEVQKSARRIIQMGLVHLIGSDGHRPETRPIKLRTAYEQVCKWSGEKTATLLFSTNTLALLQGEEPQLPPRVSWLRRLVS